MIYVNYSPGGSHHWQRNGQTNSQIGPHEGRGLQEEPVSEEERLESELLGNKASLQHLV